MRNPLDKKNYKKMKNLRKERKRKTTWKDKWKSKELPQMKMKKKSNVKKAT
jgi:hypothetical protein